MQIIGGHAPRAPPPPPIPTALPQIPQTPGGPIDAHPYKILYIETCQPWSRNQNEFINASSNGSDEPAQKHGLPRAFSVRTHIVFMPAWIKRKTGENVHLP